MINGEPYKSDTKDQIIGTWITEHGTEKLVISKGSLIYIEESIGLVGSCTYVTEQFGNEEDEFVLYPTKENEMPTLGAIEVIKYSGANLVGSILVHDVDAHTTEFRKEW